MSDDNQTPEPVEQDIHALIRQVLQKEAAELLKATSYSPSGSSVPAWFVRLSTDKVLDQICATAKELGPQPQQLLTYSEEIRPEEVQSQIKEALTSSRLFGFVSEPGILVEGKFKENPSSSEETLDLSAIGKDQTPAERSSDLNEVILNTLVQQTHEFLFERRKTLLDKKPEGQKIKMSSLSRGQASLKQAFDYGDRNSQYGLHSIRTKRTTLQNLNLSAFLQEAHLKLTPENKAWSQTLERLVEFLIAERKRSKMIIVTPKEHKPQVDGLRANGKAIDEVVLVPPRPRDADDGTVWIHRAKPKSSPTDENSEVTTYGAPRYCEAVKFLANWEIQSQAAQPSYDGLTANQGVFSAFRTLDQQKALEAKAVSRPPISFFYEHHPTRPSPRGSPFNSVASPPTCYTPDPNTP